MDWMELAMDYACENRAKMMEAAQNAVKAKVEKFTDYRVVYADDINCHHNYASMKEHYWKEESFDTSSHGVGRRHS